MSDAGETAAGADPEPTPGNTRRGNRRTTIFVAIFAITVFSLLMGYRFLVGTEFNAWYLFQVARNTSQVLALIGESAGLEGLSEVLTLPVKQVRAERAAWARGEKTSTPEDLARADDSPLTPWEQYMYRFEKKRATTGFSTLGPHVFFVLRRTTTTELQEARAQMDTFIRDSAGQALTPELTIKKKNLEDEVRALTKKIQEERAAQDGKRTRPYAFSFRVISECGAIEVMAIFFSAVIAFPTTWRKRVIGLVAGLPLMYLLNIGRLSCLGVIGALDSSQGRKLFDFAHEYVWQAVYIVFVVVVWMIWIELVVRRRAR